MRDASLSHPTRLQVRPMLATCPLSQPLSNRGYSPVVMVESFLVAVWVGGQGRKKVLRISVPPKRLPWFEGLFARIEGFHPSWGTCAENV